MATVWTIEQLLTVADLRVIGIFDFQPRVGAAVGPIGTVRPLPDDAFQIVLTRSSEQIRAARVNVIETQQSAVHDWHEAEQDIYRGGGVPAVSPFWSK